MSVTTATFGDLTGPFQAAEGALPDALLIFLHGYGANGQDLFGLAQPMLASPQLGHLDFAIWSPNAPQRLPGMGGPFSPMEAYQWFAISDLNLDELAVGVQSIGPTVSESILAASASTGVPLDRIAVVGFSQGGMVALEACLALDNPVACVVGLSTAYLGKGRESAVFSRPSVTLVHGDVDGVVPPRSLGLAVENLSAAGIDARAHMLSGLEHSIDQRALDIAINAVSAALA